MLRHNRKFYEWSHVFLISGLCQEDFIHDYSGSAEEFDEKLKDWIDSGDSFLYIGGQDDKPESV